MIRTIHNKLGKFVESRIGGLVAGTASALMAYVAGRGARHNRSVVREGPSAGAAGTQIGGTRRNGRDAGRSDVALVAIDRIEVIHDGDRAAAIEIDLRGRDCVGPRIASAARFSGRSVPHRAQQVRARLVARVAMPVLNG